MFLQKLNELDDKYPHTYLTLYSCFLFFGDFLGLGAPQYPKNDGARHSSIFPKFQHRDFYRDPESCDFYIFSIFYAHSYTRLGC